MAASPAWSVVTLPEECHILDFTGMWSL